MKNYNKSLIKIIYIFALTVCAVGVLFYPVSAYCQVLRPWDINVKIVHDNYTWNYRLSDNIEGISNDQISARGVYKGYKGKLAVVEYLLNQGYTSAEAYSYVLDGVKTVVDDIKNKINKKATDATAKFVPDNNTKFIYTEGKDGRAVDEIALYKAILNSCGKPATAVVSVPYKTIHAVSVDQLKQDRVVLGTFTTSFTNSNASRSHNIALAVKSIKGTVLNNGDTFSFNSVVGDRTEARGYKNAKVIVNGKYVDGVGGGVCQASTTLYNTALLSGLNINKVYSHTLVPSYVKSAFDAMVSYPNCDLVFTNNTGKTVYIDGFVKDKTVTFTFYGKNEQGIKRVRESVEVLRVPFTQKEIVDNKKYPDLVYTDQVKVLVNGSDMVKSSAYLCIYKDDKLIERRLLRTVTYKMVEKVIARGDKQRPEVNNDDFIMESSGE